MAGVLKGRTVKCDQKVNITAAFGSDLVLEGFTSLPNILLKVYVKIGITDFQMMILIHMIRLHVEEKEYFPSPELLSRFMSSDTDRIKREIDELIEKDIVSISEFYDSASNTVFKGYDFDPLFLKISDVWAAMKAREIEESKSCLKSDGYGYERVRDMFDVRTAGLISVFEKEFGRALSPMEAEQISQWADETDADLIVEALKRAVLRGKHNFKYINGILLEWKKNNLRTLQSIAEYDADFQRRRAGKDVRAGRAVNKNDSKRKALIRSLYI
ncbi:MAG TPA: DnaD domain protein [Bacillota bacterium]|nr:DnaD domain protein [Bacillota bacterium]